MKFENNPLDIDELPQLDETAFKPISPSWKVINIIILLLCLILLPVLIASGLFFIEKPPIASLILSLGGIASLIGIIYILASYSKIGFLAREHDFSFRKGIFWQKQTTLPYNRIQHAEISQGPLERKWQLATLTLFSAGGMLSDLKIAGLPLATAEKLKQFILSHIKQDKTHDSESNT